MRSAFEIQEKAIMNNNKGITIFKSLKTNYLYIVHMVHLAATL